MRPLLQRYGLELALCAACCCATLLLDGGRARTELLWGDEIVSVYAIQQSPGGLVEHRYWQGHSPLYFLLLKLWIFVSSGMDGLARPSEFLLRLPSLICMGLAGGLLAAAAWRAWGIAAGIVLLVLWLGNNLVERYAVEARPYALLLFFLAAVVMLVEDRGFMKRPITYLAQMELIESLQPEEIVGMADSWAIMTNLAYYLPNRTGLRVDIEYRSKPIAVANLPEDSKLYWFFNTRGPDSERAMVGDLPVLCRYALPGGNILVLGRSRAALPASMQDCPPYDGLKNLPRS